MRDMTTDEYQVYRIEAAKETGKMLREVLPTLQELDKMGDPQAVIDFARGIRKQARDIALNDLFFAGGYKRKTKLK